MPIRLAFHAVSVLAVAVLVALTLPVVADAHHRCGHKGVLCETPAPDPTPPSTTEPAPPTEPAPSIDPAPSAVPGEPAMGSVVASSNFEDATRGGMDIEQCYPGDLSLPWGGAAQGNRFGSYMVREGFNDPQTGHERCETARNNVPTLQTYYTRAWMRVPSSSYFNEWLTTIQWKTEPDPGGPPPLAMYLLPAKYRGGEYLSLRSGDSKVIAWDGSTIQRDKWYRIVIKNHMHSDPTKGYSEVWFGDASGVTKQVMANGLDRFYMATAFANTTHHRFRFGIRREPVTNAGTTIVDFDDQSIEQVTG